MDGDRKRRESRARGAADREARSGTSGRFAIVGFVEALSAVLERERHAEEDRYLPQSAPLLEH